jgi:hypothetical protein
VSALDLAVLLVIAAAISAAVAWPVAVYQVRNSFASAHERMRALLAQSRIDLEEASDQLQRWSDRGGRERARIEQAERRADRKNPAAAEPAEPTFADLKDYQRHLNRGGKRDRQYEGAMGFTVN